MVLEAAKAAGGKAIFTPTSAAKLFIEKCKKNIEDVANYVTQKLSNPSSLISFESSGALKEAVNGNLGPLQNYAEQYVTNNAQALTIAALNVLGVNPSIDELTKLLNMFYNMVASAYAAFNDILLEFTKQTARDVIRQLVIKREIRTELIDKLEAYVNTLEQMRAGPSVFDAYLDELREALLKVHLANQDLILVRGTFSSIDRFLDRKFEAAKTNLDEAAAQIKPKDNPYLNKNVLQGQLQGRQTTSTELTTPELGELRQLASGDGGRVTESTADRFFERLPSFANVAPGDLLVTNSVFTELTSQVDGIPIANEQLVLQGQTHTVLEVVSDIELIVDPPFEFAISGSALGVGTATADPVTYKVERLDGLDADGITLYDRSAAFLENGPMAGHLVKFHEPNYRSIRVASVVSEFELKLVAHPRERDGYEFKPTPSVAYEVRINSGVPTDQDQFSNIVAIPAMTRDIVLAGKGYFSATFKANQGMQLFIGALDGLLATMPGLMKDYALNIFDEGIKSTRLIKENMSTLLNGNPNRLTANNAFTPDTISVSASTFKWLADINLVRGLLEFIPADALKAANLSQNATNAYRQAVARLQTVDTYSTGNATVEGTDGQEELGQLESQLFLLLVEGSTLILSGSAREEIIALGRSIIRNLKLAQSRDDDVENILQAWIDYPIPFNSELNEMMFALRKMLKDAGLFKTAKLFDDGNWLDLFGLGSGRQATYVGAALIALALLQECFDTPEEKEELNEIVNELQKEEQLGSISLSINFDFLIFKKLEECTKFENLATNLNLKEILCGLLKEAGAGKLLDSIGEKMDFMSSPGEKSATSTIAENQG